MVSVSAILPSCVDTSPVYCDAAGGRWQKKPLLQINDLFDRKIDFGNRHLDATAPHPPKREKRENPDLWCLSAHDTVIRQFLVGANYGVPRDLKGARCLELLLLVGILGHLSPILSKCRCPCALRPQNIIECAERNLVARGIDRRLAVRRNLPHIVPADDIAVARVILCSDPVPVAGMTSLGPLLAGLVYGGVGMGVKFSNNLFAVILAVGIARGRIDGSSFPARPPLDAITTVGVAD